MIFVELDNYYRFVQYHTSIDTVSVEHTDFVIKISNSLYDLLQQKMPWQLASFDVNKTYDTGDIELFVEISPPIQLSDKERIEQLEQMINLILMGEI